MALPDLRLITPPDGLPLTLDEAKRHLRIGDPDDPSSYTVEDDLLTGLIGAAAGIVGGRSGLLFRVLMPQQWAQYYDNGFPPACGFRQANPGRIVLPLGPVVGIGSIKYVDADGETQTLDPSAYEFFPAEELDDAFVLPAWETQWPQTRAKPRAVAVTYNAGYVDGLVPPAIKIAMLLMLADFYKNRETTILTVRGVVPVNPAAAALLEPYRRVMV